MVGQFNFDTQVIAHRGASSHAPENTIAAFKKAAEMGFYFIEFDVMLSSCGEIVVIHDETLNRTTNGKGNVCDYDYKYLKTLDAGSWGPWAGSEYKGERIPKLTHVLNFLRVEKEMKANVELKPLPGQEAELVKRVVEVMGMFLKSENHRIIFSSFSVEVLRCLRRALPECSIGLLMSPLWRSDWQNICVELDCASVNVDHWGMLPCLASKVKSQGYALLCYTVDGNVRAQQLFDWGVDAVFSNKPDEVLLKPAYRCAVL